METLLINIKNEKAKQFLTDLAALDLIEIKEQTSINSNGKLSELRGKIKSCLTEEEIDEQLQKLRNEWQRAI